MAVKAPYDFLARLFHRELGKLHLKPVKRMNFQFDPFHERVTSIRDFLFHVTARRKRKTNDQCMIKTEVVCDRSEPVLNVILEDGTNVTFKTANLSALEITEELNNIISRYDVPEEEPVTKLKGRVVSKQK